MNGGDRLVALLYNALIRVSSFGFLEISFTPMIILKLRSLLDFLDVSCSYLVSRFLKEI